MAYFSWSFCSRSKSFHLLCGISAWILKEEFQLPKSCMRGCVLCTEHGGYAALAAPSRKHNEQAVSLPWAMVLSPSWSSYLIELSSNTLGVSFYLPSPPPLTPPPSLPPFPHLFIWFTVYSAICSFDQWLRWSETTWGKKQSTFWSLPRNFLKTSESSGHFPREEQPFKNISFWYFSPSVNIVGLSMLPSRTLLEIYSPLHAGGGDFTYQIFKHVLNVSDT